jgi:hypothetical protein
MCAHVRVPVCVCANLCVRACVHAVCACACVRVCMPCVCVCACACVHAVRACACVHAVRACACVHAVRACACVHAVRACACVRVRVCPQVVVTPGTEAAIAKARAEGTSLWRVSSTCFYHINSDQSLAPVAHFADLPSAAAYPAVDAGEQVRQELEHIKLGGVAARLEGSE